MRDFLRYGLTVITLAFVLSALAACDDKEILKRMEAHSKSLKSLRADITMERYNVQLAETDVSKGKLLYLPPGKGTEMAARVDWLSPTQESAAVVNKQFVVYRPRLKQAYTGTTDQREIAAALNEGLAFLNVSQDNLKTDYNIRILGREKMSDGIKAFHLEFTPKVRKRYKTLELWADNKGTPVLIKVTENNNDTIKILFSNVEKNVALDAGAFKINLPKGTKLIRN
jgi:outer membrane lipoprotein-sorting protein